MTTQYFITPRVQTSPYLPSAPGSIPVPPISLWVYGPIPTVLVFPGEIDPPRLIRAIEDISSIWPTVAGRYVRNNTTKDAGKDEFSIRLTGSAIPLTTQTISRDTAFPDKHVVQPSLTPYIPDMPVDNWLPSTDSPLLTLRLTTLLPSKDSVLGIKWSHILGDAASCYHFISLLSKLYVGVTENALDSKDYPNFGPHIAFPTYPPGPEAIDRYDIPQIRPRSMTEMQDRFRADAESSEMVVISLSRVEMDKMKEECYAVSQERLSDQDILSGWWIWLLESLGHAVKKVVYAVNYRGLHKGNSAFPSTLPTLSGNAAQLLAIPLPPRELDQNALQRRVALSRAIRAGLAEIRKDAKTTLEWLSVAAYRLEEAAINGEAALSLPDEKEVMVNSNLRYSWVIPFGFPLDQTAYHTAWSANRNLRVFEANLEPGQSMAGGAIEMVFNVTRGSGDSTALHDLLESERERWSSL